MKSVMKILILCGVFLFMAFGCEKERADEYEDIPVQYAKCPCNHDTDFVKKISYENVLLFDSAKTTFNQMEKLSFNGEYSEFLYYTENGSLQFRSIRSMHRIVTVCNPPTKALKKIMIPDEGIIVKFEGELYPSCEENFIMEIIYENLVLTTFKIKKR